MITNRLHRDIWVCFLFLAISAWVTVQFHGIKVDDAYITFQDAKHLAQGRGMVFNVGERYQSSSGPLFAVVLGVLGIPNPDLIPTIAEVISCLSLFAISWGLYIYGRLWDKELWGVLAALIFMTSPLTWEAFTFEFLPQIAAVLWAYIFYFSARAKSRPAVGSAIALALATLIRPDGLLAAGALVLTLAIWMTAGAARSAWAGKNETSPAFLAAWKARARQETRILTLPAICWYLAIVVCFYGAITLYYGKPFPGTMAAKSAPVVGGFVPHFISRLLERFLLAPTRQFPMLQEVSVLAILGCLAAFKFPRVVLPLFVFAALHALAYQIVPLPFFNRYAMPEMLGVAGLAAAAVAWLIESVYRFRPLRYPAVAAAAAGCALFAYANLRVAPMEFHVPTRNTPWEHSSKMYLYPQVALWLQRNTSPTDWIGYPEPGLIGYCSDRRFVDPLGLVTPGETSHIKAGRISAAYIERKPSYILNFESEDPKGSGVWSSYWKGDMDLGKQPWFQESYRLVGVVINPPFRVVIYRRLVAASAGTAAGN